MSGNRPVKVFRYYTKFNNIDVALWGGEQGKLLSALISKSYKTKEGEWKKTNYFAQSDLMILIPLLLQAVTWVSEHNDLKDAGFNSDEQPIREVIPTEDDIPF